MSHKQTQQVMGSAISGPSLAGWVSMSFRGLMRGGSRCRKFRRHQGSAMVPVSVRFELFGDDVERSLAFYAASLGLQPPPGYDPQGYVPVSAGQVRIGLQRRTALPAEHHFRPAHFADPRGVAVEIVIEVDDVDAAFARTRDAARTHGGQVEPLAARPWGRPTSASSIPTATTSGSRPPVDRDGRVRPARHPSDRDWETAHTRAPAPART